MKNKVCRGFFRFCMFSLVALGAQAQQLSSANTMDGSPIPLRMGLKTAPQPLETVRPEFPRKHWKKKLALVELEGSITAGGDVKDARVLSGDQAIADLALAAVRTWKYSPARANGTPVETTHHFYLVFSKQDHSVHLGPDELSPDLPLQPSDDVSADLAAGKIFRVGKGVAPPRTTYAPDPSYSELARKLKYQGTSTLAAIITADGHARSVWVVVPAGEGLDEKAVEAVSTWKFKPAMRGDDPVAVLINVDVSFHLY